MAKIKIMRKIAVTVLLIVSMPVIKAQTGVLDRARQSAKNKVNQKVDQKVDKAIDKAINKADTVIDGTKSLPGKPAQQQSGATGSASASADNKPQAAGTAIRASSKFDFVTGEKIIVVEDFSQDAVGDFPVKWNTSSSGEVVTIDGQQGKWLALKKGGIFYPEFITSLPENFTLEYDVAASSNYNTSSAAFSINIIQVPTENDFKAIIRNSGNRFYAGNSTNGITIQIHPNYYGTGSYFYRTLVNGAEQLYHSEKQTAFTTANNLVHVSIWKQKERIRVYLNQEKIIDLPKVMTSTCNKIIFSPDYTYVNEDMLYFSNLRLAAGEANARDKLITEGKYITHGILFETGSDKINPQSTGILKEIAAVLTENRELKVKIVGHTDSDGNDAANLNLSDKRAAAVKNVLVTVFAIDAVRLSTIGKGETQPVAPNTTAEGKANNRRVEFIKE
jgi:OmpA-OmpF porin, OOP family